MDISLPWLSILIWVPIFTSLLILFIGSCKNKTYFRYIAFFSSLFSLLISLFVLYNFNVNKIDLQFVECSNWISYINIPYHVGIDGFSIWFIPLTTFITFLTVLVNWVSSKENAYQYYSGLLMLSGLLIGVFSSANGILFYIFFEATLIPMYLIIGIWGGANRIYASFKFFLYTLLGSLLLLIALLYLYRCTGTAEIRIWHTLSLSITEQILLFSAFFFAFAVKIPMWPFHTWLPDVHVEAPTEASIFLAAIMLKLGGYGFIRFSLPITPYASYFFAPAMIFLSIFAIIFISLIALVQSDIKKVVAYSSIVHMGFVTLGIFIFDPLALQGAIVQMISHGFVSAAMFFCIGLLYERAHTREMNDYGGVADKMPLFSIFSMFFSIANIAMPGTSGFVGEMMVIFGAMRFNFFIAFLASAALVLSAAYTLLVYRNVYFGKVNTFTVDKLKDINFREFFILFLLVLPVLFIGFYPKLVTLVINKSVINLLEKLYYPKVL